MGKDKVYIILVNFNGWHHTIECIESLLQSDYSNYQIIVVDNDSSDHSIEHIKAWADGKLSLWPSDSEARRKKAFDVGDRKLPYIFYSCFEVGEEAQKILAQETEQTNNEFSGKWPMILIQTGKNIGFAGGNNVGIRFVMNEGDGAYVWLLNNDTIVEEDSLTNLILKMGESEKTGAVGSVLMSYSMPSIVRTLGGGVIYKYLGFTYNICKNQNYDQQFIDKTLRLPGIDFISGCSILVTNEVIRNVGLLDPEYFIYWEDADWSERIKHHGYSLAHANKSIVYHKESQSSSAYTGSYYSTFNCFRFFRKYYRHALPVAFVNRLFFVLFIAVKKRNLSYLKGSLRAYCDFLKTVL